MRAMLVFMPVIVIENGRGNQKKMREPPIFFLLAATPRTRYTSLLILL